MVLIEFLSACCLLGLLSDSEGGGSTFLQNFTKFLPDYIPTPKKNSNANAKEIRYIFSI
jgi:hypothetical protein